MHRIDTPTAQIDKFGQGKNGFTNGDPSTGRRATDLNSDMWDAVQEEMANAIELIGITLDKSKHNQLYLAIQKAITDPGFLKKANNLSDLEDVVEARGNLQLGTAATKNVGAEKDNVMQVGAFGLGGGSNHKSDAYNNVGEIYRVNNTSSNAPTTGVAGVVSLPCDGGPSTGYIAVSNAGAAWVGSSNKPQNGIPWHRVYTTAYKPTAADVGLGNVGNFMAVQQGGGANQGDNKIKIGWGKDYKLRLTVDMTDQGVIFTENNPPPYPVTSINGRVGAISLNDGFSSDGTGMWWDSVLSSLRIQIGSWSIGAQAGTSTTVAFPKAFPNLCLFVVPVPDLSMGSAAATEQVGIGGRTNTTVTITKGSGDSVARGGKYLAIGY